MNTAILAQDIRPEPGAILRSCILALDLGTTTGWALRSHDGLVTSGTVSCRPGRFDGGGPYGDRGLADEFYWAAAELWATTGEAA